MCVWGGGGGGGAFIRSILSGGGGGGDTCGCFSELTVHLNKLTRFSVFFPLSSLLLRQRTGFADLFSKNTDPWKRTSLCNGN